MTTRGKTTGWGPLLAGFHRHLLAARRAPKTIRLRRWQLLDLAERHRSPARITTAHLEAIIGATAAAETAKSLRAAYRTFFAWAVRAGHLEHNPALDLPSVYVGRRLPRPAPEPVIHAGLREAKPREAFMIRLGAYAGLRVQEIARVHRRDWDGRWLRVIGKGDKERVVPITQAELCWSLDQLEGWAFPNRWTGRPITAGHVSKLLSAALAETYTGHQLRHRFVTVTVNRTKDIGAAAEVVGHEKLDTTRQYQLVANERLLAIADAAA